MENSSYLDTYDKSLCCGCRACEQICKKNAINMQYDEEGFIYPQINESLCIECGACKGVCPVRKVGEKKFIRKIYAAQNLNEKELKKSSSGGVFINIAKYVLDNNGVVFGTVLNEDNEAIIVSTFNKEELEAMQGSKYVFSGTGNTYMKTERYLKEGRPVLYTGSPCQIAGLKRFLRKDFENLITMDFLCHGMPSSKIFKENIVFLSKKYKGKISGYKFRDKTLKGWGHVTSFYSKNIKRYEPGKLNAYFHGFIEGYLNRYICYTCPFRGEKRYSDITVGDFWGCDIKQFDIKKGISFMSINTEKGEYIFDILKNSFVFAETTKEVVAKMNSTLIHDGGEEIPAIRKIIYKEMNVQGYKYIENKYLRTEKEFVLRMKLMFDWLMSKIKQGK